ncbi:MAG TPA: protoporphyrinogen oxidase HemJ [Cyanobacteria bacterium UBA11149]|nr:protoporphyrinogen oxidase HemJ [Cyanobacteria bacterium UBA11367]HBE58299.1 protoporphyrinogen oxidase HemJ [Cyanobacteria bacterium UBA11366]HBK65764.1 protoporphyrinogen oxidase HemJ [Cyanobacteria bacterium UBA11166]HBR73028.1 protoporphyrinogen oxidase HemJ [Cyanobacteria bacterium UBA11159]HBS68886.1 protoporphyrinogen oxidase HemJ [Cyanobacteria bacterium UBA11153]HBW88175.1 protoporphyrinogen oxidase HemJ [Cyanobacteria bacterium UBA11149]HCA97218.1 protoporphyrinogen oxidase HemJ 
MAYYWFKAFHLIGVVVWFAGLFYLVRLFVYHAEASQQPQPAQTILKNQYEIMEKRLYHIITMPGMVVTVSMAIGLLVTQPEFLKQGWMHFKLAFVVALLIYHFYCGRIMKKLAAGECNWTGQQFRALNEAPTVLLVAIVLLAVFKNSLPTNLAGLSILVMIILMAASIQLYAKKRRLDAEKQRAAAQAKENEITGQMTV